MGTEGRGQHRPVSEECRHAVDRQRGRQPKHFPDRPHKPGEAGPTIELDADEGATLIRRAMGESGGGAPLLWTKLDSRLVVDADDARIDLDEGLLVVTVPVRCEQTGRAEVQVGFAVGSPRRPAGVVAAAGDPRGPREVVDVWGEELTALAWGAVVRVVTALARHAGRDVDGQGLVPIALVAHQGLAVATAARHHGDRGL